MRQAMLSLDAEILSYMDIDLSTDLKAFPLLIQALIDGADIAIGSRHLPGSKVKRSFKRTFFSLYNLSLTKKNNWFLDTELLIFAQRKGFPIKEITVS